MATSGSWSVEWASSTWSGHPKGYRWKGNWNKSGNSITLSGMTLQIYMISGTGWGGATDSVTVTGGAAQTVSWTMSGSESNVVGLNNTSFSVDGSATSATIQCAIVGENTGATTINFDASYSPPTGLSVSAPYNITPHGATFDVSISSYGNPSSANGRWIEAGITGQNTWTSPYLRSAIATNTKTAAITVDNFSTKTTTLVVQPNTQYYYGGYAWNTQKDTRTIAGQFVTTAESPTITPATITDSTATFTYSVAADGGYYDKTIEYSIDGGTTWTTVTTITGGSATSGTFTISGLTASTRYTLKTKVTTTVGTTNSKDIIFIAKSGLTNAFYVSANSQSAKTSTLYGSINGQSKIITKLYGPANDQAKLVHQSFGHADRNYGELTYYDDPSHTTTKTVKIVDQSQVDSMAKAGAGSWSITIGGTTIANTDIKEIVLEKNVASVPDYFLRACTALDSIDISRSSLTTTGTGFLYGCTSFNQTLTFPSTLTSFGTYFLYGCTSYNKAITIPSTITNINRGFMYSCEAFDQPMTIPSTLTNIGADFMRYCIAFNSALTLPNTLTEIPSGFLYNCASFNQPLTLPGGLTTIGNNFMYYTSKFNRPITLPSTLTSIGTAFLGHSRDMTSVVDVGALDASIAATSNPEETLCAGDKTQAPAFLTGIPIAGSARATWLSRFPNNSSAYPYRNLLDAGY